MAMTKQEAAAELQRCVNALNKTVVDSGDWRTAYDQVARAWENLRDPDRATTATTIAEFFGSIGNGLIDAQRNLDRESEKYVKRALRLDNSGTDAVPGAPTMFRIPRVNAELKCSLETNRDKKLNLIFYSDRQDVRELHQQTVNLEVVSVPAPPDYINALRAPQPPQAPQPTAGQSAKITATTKPPAQTRTEKKPDDKPGDQPAAIPDEQTNESTEDPEDHGPAIPFARPNEGWDELPAGWQGRFATDAVRAEARTMIEQLDAKETGQESSPVKDLLLPAWPQALIFTDGDNARFIVLALEGEKPELMLWELLLRPPSLQMIYRMPNAPAPGDVARLLRMLAEIGAVQGKPAAES